MKRDAFSCDGKEKEGEMMMWNDCSKSAYLNGLTHPKSNINAKLLQRVEQMREESSGRYARYLSKVIKNIKSGHLSLH